MTRFPQLHRLLTGDPLSVENLQAERLSLLTRQVGCPENRKRLQLLTHEQLREQVNGGKSYPDNAAGGEKLRE